MRDMGLSLRLPLPHLSGKSDNWRQKLYRSSIATAASPRACWKCEDSDEQWCTAGRMVDEGMPVLKKRLKEIKALDRGSGKYSVELVELEEGYCHTLFATDMIELLGLMKLRSSTEEERMPKLLIGFSVMLTIYLPVPLLVAVLHLKDAAKGLVDVMHLNGHNRFD